MCSHSQPESTDYIALLLADRPEIIDAAELARLCGWKDYKAVHQKKHRIPRDDRGRVKDEFQGTLLPFLIVPPGGGRLIFTKQAVYDWFKNGGPQVSTVKRRGRPPGSKSRRGTGRAELEARS